MPPIQVFELGKDGVILDLHPLQPDLPPNALANAQNAYHDPKAGHGGALRKRAGLQKLNGTAAGDAILGGIPMTVEGTAGASVAGTGSTGSSSGAGEGTGAPGGTTDGTGTGDAGGTGAGEFTDTELFSGARLLAIGVDTNNTNDGQGWVLTSKKFQDASIAVTSPGPPGAAGNTGYKTQQTKTCVQTPDGWLYYMKANNESTSGNTPQIRRTNGATDQLVYTVPAKADPNDQALCMGMAYGNGKVFVGIRDSVYNAATQTGRLLVIQHSSLVVSVVENLTRTPFCACYASNGRVYIGMNPDYTTAASSSGRIDFYSQSAGTVSTVLNGTFNESFVTCIVEFGGCLYFGALADSTGSHGGFLYGVDFDNDVLGGLDTSSQSSIAGDDLDTYTAEAPTDAFAGVYDMIEFNGKLIISWWNGDGGVSGRMALLSAEQTVQGTRGLDNITSRKTVTGTNAVPVNLFVDDGVLYAIGSISGSGKDAFFYSEDGETWTDATSTVALPTTNSMFSIGVFGGFNQA